MVYPPFSSVGRAKSAFVTEKTGKIAIMKNTIRNLAYDVKAAYIVKHQKAPTLIAPSSRWGKALIHGKPVEQD